jgi:hypothetical protein
MVDRHPNWAELAALAQYNDVAGVLAFFILIDFAQDLEKWQGLSVVSIVARRTQAVEII